MTIKSGLIIPCCACQLVVSNEPPVIAAFRAGSELWALIKLKLRMRATDDRQGGSRLIFQDRVGHPKVEEGVDIRRAFPGHDIGETPGAIEGMGLAPDIHPGEVEGAIEPVIGRKALPGAPLNFRTQEPGHGVVWRERVRP